MNDPILRAKDDVLRLRKEAELYRLNELLDKKIERLREQSPVVGPLNPYRKGWLDAADEVKRKARSDRMKALWASQKQPK